MGTSISSLPGGQIQHFYKFIPAKDKYTLIVLFLGGNNLYNGTDDWEADIEEIANDLVELANKFTTVAKKVFVIRIPPRGENFARAQSLNDLLKQKTDVSWKFRSSNHYLKSKKCRKIRDEVHLNENGINNLKNLLKDNILYKLYDPKLRRKGNGRTIECHSSGFCNRGSSSE